MTKSMAASAANFAIDRERKRRDQERIDLVRSWKPPYARRWNRLGLPMKMSWNRKPRRVYGRTFWSHSHDV